MIRVNRLNNKELVVNCDLILFVEETPDTVITLTTGQKIVVTNSVDEILEKVTIFKAKIMEYKRKNEQKEV